MDSVKEALAAELVPVIWWFITHCKLVEDDDLPQPPSPVATAPLEDGEFLGSDGEAYPRPLTPRPDELAGDEHVVISLTEAAFDEQPEEGPTLVSVQAFTPILGTLLLSPNGIVGGSARYAVVELLRRARRADDREDGVGDFSSPPTTSTSAQGQLRSVSPTPSQEGLQESDALDLGLFQRQERQLFERELVYQVVIGMGRLDAEERVDQQPEDVGDDPILWSGSSTAVPTPQAPTSAAEAQSYFPLAPALAPAAPTDPATADASPPPQSAEQALPAGVAVLSPGPSPSPPVSSTSSLSGSPGHSSSSTPSLTSSTSSSSGEYPDAAESVGGEHFDLAVEEEEGELPLALGAQAPIEEDEPRGRPEMKISLPVNDWTPTRAPPAALPTTPPFEVPPPPPPVAAPVPVAAEAASPISVLPMLQVHAPPSASPVREHQPSGWASPGTAARELQAMEDQQEAVDDGSDLSEEAAVGRLSSMSLMAAVTASGK